MGKIYQKPGDDNPSWILVIVLVSIAIVVGLFSQRHYDAVSTPTKTEKAE